MIVWKIIDTNLDVIERCGFGGHFNFVERMIFSDVEVILDISFKFVSETEQVSPSNFNSSLHLFYHILFCFIYIGGGPPLVLFLFYVNVF